MSTGEGENAKKRARNDEENHSPSSEQEEASKESLRKYHRGKWTSEECEYLLGLMEAFKAGHLPLREGTTLRSFLSSMMKCKPKRISKKFEGISYNGRMVYQKSKEPMSLQNAMLLKARLSELERRYLAAAAEQRDGGNDSIEALLQQEPVLQTPESTAAFSSVLERESTVSMTSFNASVPAAASLQGANLASGNSVFRPGGLEAKPNANPTEDMVRLMRGQTMLAGARRSLAPSVPACGSSLHSAGLTDGNDLYRLFSQQRHIAPRAEFTGPSSQSLRLGIPSQLHQLEQQQKLASLSTTNAASALAAMQLQERTLASQLSETAMTGSLSFPSSLRNEMIPSVSRAFNTASDMLSSMDTVYPKMSPGYPNLVLNSAQQNSVLNRYVLQPPQDDASYFRQRLLPGVASSQNNAGAHQTLPSATRASLGASNPFGVLPVEGLYMGNLAEYLSRQTQANQNCSQNLKR